MQAGGEIGISHGEYFWPYSTHVMVLQRCTNVNCDASHLMNISLGTCEQEIAPASYYQTSGHNDRPCPLVVSHSNNMHGKLPMANYLIY